MLRDGGKYGYLFYIKNSGGWNIGFHIKSNIKANRQRRIGLSHQPGRADFGFAVAFAVYNGFVYDHTAIIQIIQLIHQIKLSAL